VLASVRLDFDPSTSIFGLSLRLETLALAGVILVVLLLAAIGAGRAGAGAAAPDDAARAALPKLRRDDLILIAFGAVPGAVVGGRLDYALLHLDYYRATSGAITDPAQGGYGLALAVVLGTLTAIAVANLLAAPISRWLGVASVPVLLGLGLGKLAMALGGEGQGAYSSASWATSYMHSGDWGSLNPTFPAVPSQLIEGGLVLAAAIVVIVLPFPLRLRIRRWGPLVRPGFAPRHDWRYLTGWRRYVTVLGLWAAARFAVAFTWRDAQVYRSLDVEQIILLVLAAATFVAMLTPLVTRTIHRGWVAWAAHRAASRAATAARTAAAAEAAEAARAAAAAEAARVAAEAEAARHAAQAEAARHAAEAEAARHAAQAEAARVAAAAEAARIAAAAEAARLAEAAEAARLAAQAEAARLHAEALRLAAETESARVAADAKAAPVTAEAEAEAEAKTQLKAQAATSSEPEPES
jgi:prolipoprotein diacylglyceryltransferase